MKLYTIVLLLCICTSAYSQIEKICCDEIFDKNDSIEELTGFYEKPPTSIGVYKTFYENVSKETDGSFEVGKVYVQFVVDTLGDVHCASVVKTDNELLNARAIEIIKMGKFTPAEQRGRKVVSIMVLPLTFGIEPSDKKKKKCKD